MPPPLHNPRPPAPLLLLILRSWGRDWVPRDVKVYAPILLMWAGFQSGALTCVSNGSYNRQLDPFLAASGWIIYSHEVDRILVSGTLSEQNPHASAYRAEWLGTMAVHLFLLAVLEHKSTTGTSAAALWLGSIMCDNKGVIFWLGSDRRISRGAPQCNIIRTVMESNGCLQTSHRYEHVYGH
jgi:hypothetical protein